MATRTRKMIRPSRAFFEISVPHVGEKSSMLIEAVSTPAWTASDFSSRARSSPPRALTLTSLCAIPSADASAPTTSARVTEDTVRWVMSDGAIPAWSANAFFTPDAVADAGVGEDVGLAVGVAEAVPARAGGAARTPVCRGGLRVREGELRRRRPAQGVQRAGPDRQRRAAPPRHHLHLGVGATEPPHHGPDLVGCDPGAVGILELGAALEVDGV